MIQIIENGNPIEIGIPQIEVADRLGISRGGIKSVLDCIGLEPTIIAGRNVYPPDKIRRLGGLISEFPRRKGVRWDPPQDLLDKYDLP